jgi:hypothetical protein
MFHTRCHTVDLPTPREFLLVKELIWDDGKQRIVVPERFVTDFASIPKALRIIFDVNGRSRRAAVLHDYLYCARSLYGFTRREADDLFLTAMVAEKVGFFERRTMHAGVRAGGWAHWKKRSGMLEDQDFDFEIEVSV